MGCRKDSPSRGAVSCRRCLAPVLTGCGWKHGLAGVGAKTSPYGVNAPNQMGLAQIPVGRWAYLRLKGGREEGILVTIPYTLEFPCRLAVDFEDSGKGSLELALIGDDGSHLPGYGYDQCDELKAGGRWLPVTWKGKGLESTEVKTFSIGVRLRGHGIRLFGLEFQAVA